MPSSGTCHFEQIKISWCASHIAQLSGGHFLKIGIHVSRKFSHFTFLKSLFQKCMLSFHISQITFHVSHFKFHFYTNILHFTLKSWSVKWDLWNGKCEMRITFHVSQMPNVICETNMKREFKFSKNVLLQMLFGRLPFWAPSSFPGYTN